ncbi:MAG: 2-C-methyl-D-erythritol 4-phosphate cytidylyltransferase [Clostridia bacterium]|nr:2-C-methyl-D-erythritol 4-phosphate cytidylyltransferase [Clostridia bacterium]
MSKATQRICRVLRILTGKKRPRTTAILLAGGIGSRMARSDRKTKQMLLLGGKPILAHTAIAFQACSYIDDIIVVTRADELSAVTDMMASYGIKKFRRAVVGGETRQESALRGFEAIDDAKCRFVAIHDVARCLIRPEQIATVVGVAYGTGAAAAASRVHDTVKRANSRGEVIETVDREELWYAQTPQVFSATLYRAAAYTAWQAKFMATDDMMLCERIGQTVRLVDCTDENFKITTDIDLLRAEAVLRAREGAT